jgi:hypothetical protein
MIRGSIQFMIRADGASGPALLQVFDSNERLDVRDLNTRVTLQVRAADVSPYRHTLLINGGIFRILSIKKASRPADC